MCGAHNLHENMCFGALQLRHRPQGMNPFHPFSPEEWSPTKLQTMLRDLFDPELTKIPMGPEPVSFLGPIPFI